MLCMSLCWESFPFLWSGLDMNFVQLKHLYYMASGQLHCCICSKRERMRSFQSTACKSSPCVSCWVRPIGHRDQHSLLKLILLCIFFTWVKHSFIQDLCESYLSWNMIPANFAGIWHAGITTPGCRQWVSLAWQFQPGRSFKNKVKD